MTNQPAAATKRDPDPVSRVSKTPSEFARLATVYTIESLGSIASTLLNTGIFFYTVNKFGWTLQKNLLLSAGQGFLYIISALMAQGLTARFGRRIPLAGGYFATALVVSAVLFLPGHIVTTVALLLSVLVQTQCWPILEHLTTAGRITPLQMARRVAIYNLVWSGIGVLIVAVTGTLIEHFADGVFIIPIIAALIGCGLASFRRLEPPGGDDHYAAPTIPPDSALAGQRKLALWLSRVSVPSMYVVVYSLSAMIPLLPVVRDFRPATQTLLACVWFIARWLAFVLLGATSFWNSRPRLLLVAAFSMLVSLLLITVRPSDVLDVAPGMIDLATMIAGQVIFGFAAGLIYMSSLYFGMVLSNGSTAHGGYHEALIGLGMFVGPGIGAAAKILWPERPFAAVGAVCCVLGVGIALATFASLRFGRARG